MHISFTSLENPYFIGLTKKFLQVFLSDNIGVGGKTSELCWPTQ